MSSTQCQTVQPPVASFREHRVGFVGFLTRMVSGALGAILLWQERATQRAHLAALGDHMLKDIGISRAEADREVAKPFWRP